MPYFVYLLRCGDNTIYTGITTDLKRRLKEHKEKIGGHYTSARGAKEMIYAETYPSRSEALKREAAIKKLTREKKLALAEK